MSGNRKKESRAPQSSGALHTPKGEANAALADVADEAHPPQLAGESDPPTFEKEKEWLKATLKDMGAEKPVAFLSKGTTWVCKDHRKTLGRLPMGDVLSRNREAVAKVFDLRGAVTLTIDKSKADTDVLWAVAKVYPRIQRTVVLELLKGANEDVIPKTWAYRRAREVVQEWAKEREEASEARVKKGKDPLPKVVVSSAIIVAASRRAVDLYDQWLKTKQDSSTPPWPKSVGFDVDESNVKVKEVKEIEHDVDGKKAVRRRLIATVSILGMDGGKRSKQPELYVSPHGGSAWATMRRLLTDTERYKMRSARIINDRGKWLLKLSYTMPRPEKADGKGALVVRRGMGRFLISQGSDGKRPKLYDAGKAGGLIAIKRQMHARRCRAREHFAWQGKGARGHGKARFYKLTTKLENAEARFVKTWCQQQAASIAEKALELGYAEVIIEDFGGSSPPVHDDPFVQKILRRFPFAQLRESIEWACSKVGIPTRVQALDYDPNLCPQCALELERQPDGWCKCTCGFEAWEDTVVCWHHLLKAGVETNLKVLKVTIDKEKRAKEATDDLRAAAKNLRAKKRLFKSSPRKRTDATAN